MTLPMLETIQTETARVKMEFIRYSDDDGSVEDTIVREGGKYMPCPNEFVYLRTEVINLSRQYFLQPSCYCLLTVLK